MKGYAKESCKLLMAYGFNELCLNKIWTEIYEFDDKKRELYISLGFQQDGLLRQNYWHDGKWWNSRILSILCSEFN
jgi:RimJ/RimL family protein N-acetyltransferase